jgi:hypothetical protein
MEEKYRMKEQKNKRRVINKARNYFNRVRNTIKSQEGNRMKKKKGMNIKEV